MAFFFMNDIYFHCTCVQGYYLNVFNGCYAVLLFIVVVFFLIYGVEVYFKVRIILQNQFWSKTKFKIIKRSITKVNIYYDGPAYKNNYYKK